ncbi:MAG: NmrA family NAD(P)-binding protein [Betaproteobacteria bacterium]|nr:NmrA family NAD(P)-binding protein [Betaproteobacteria bacterium]
MRPDFNSSPLVFVSGGTGYLGAALIPALVDGGFRVRVLVRPQSRKRAMDRLPATVEFAEGDALDAHGIAYAAAGAGTFVQMVGVPHPSPSKARAFLDIDLAAAEAGLDAAVAAGVPHFVYVSVSQFPDGRIPAMRAYVRSRAAAEEKISQRVAMGGLAATFVRPWYVLGPGHRWPLLLTPLMKLVALMPEQRGRIEKMGLVTRAAFTDAMLHAIAHPPPDVHVIDVVGIRKISRFARMRA